jgi:hypothetical protein
MTFQGSFMLITYLGTYVSRDQRYPWTVACNMSYSYHRSKLGKITKKKEEK